MSLPSLVKGFTTEHCAGNVNVQKRTKAQDVPSQTLVSQAKWPFWEKMSRLISSGCISHICFCLWQGQYHQIQEAKQVAFRPAQV